MTYSYITVVTARDSYSGTIDLREISKIMMDVGLIKGYEYITIVRKGFIHIGSGSFNASILTTIKQRGFFQPTILPLEDVSLVTTLFFP